MPSENSARPPAPSVMLTAPRLVSTVEPTGISAEEASSTYVFEPGRLMRTVPLTTLGGGGVGVAVGAAVGTAVGAAVGTAVATTTGGVAVGCTVGVGVGVTSGGGPEVNVRAAGLSSGLPAGSTARTSNVCWPAGRLAGGVNGEAHAVKGPPSIRHSNVEPGSLAVNVNGAPVPPAVMVV